MKVGDLFIALGFQVDDKKLKDFNDNIKTGTLALGSMSATAAAAVYAVNRFTASSVDSSVKLSNLTAQTGVAAEEVQRFYNVAGRLNTDITLDDTINAFTQLADVIAQAKLGQGPTGEAGMLGLDNIGGMTPLEVIKQLRENFKNNVAAWGQGDERVIQNLMKQIGLGPEFIQTIKATDEEFNRLYNNPILNGDAQAKLVELAKATKEMNFQWELFKGNMSAKFSPTIINFMENLNAVLGKTVELTGEASSKFDEFQQKHDPEGKITRNVGNAAAIATGAGLVRSGSIWAKGAGLTILGATAINDAGNYLRDQPSSIGDAEGAWPSIRKFLGAPFKGFADEWAKAEQEKNEMRMEYLRQQQSPSGTIQPQSFNGRGDTFNVYSVGDPRQVALEVISVRDGRQYREAELNLGMNASGMNA